MKANNENGYDYIDIYEGQQSKTGTGIIISTGTEFDTKNNMVILTAKVTIKGKKQSEIHKKIAEKSKYNPIFHYLRRYEETPKRKNITEKTWLKKFEI
jgi:hypothetical protein